MRINLVRDLRQDEPLDVLPTDDQAPQAIETAWGLFELLLKAPNRLNPFVRSPALQPKLCAGFTIITLVGMGLYALGLFGVLLFAPPTSLPPVLRGWDGGVGSLAALMAAYPVGVLAATLLVLPSYWFLGLLAGVRMPVGEVLTHSLKGKAATTVLLVGLLPIYGVVMTCVLLMKAPEVLVTPLLWVGLVLPFLTALRGAGAIEAGFRTVVATTPGVTRSRRGGLPSALMLSWAGLFTVVVPVVMLKLYEVVIGLVGGGA